MCRGTKRGRGLGQGRGRGLGLGQGRGQEHIGKTCYCVSLIRKKK